MSNQFSGYVSALGNSETHWERINTRMIGKLPTYALVAFTPISSRMTFLTSLLCYLGFVACDFATGTASQTAIT